MSHRASGLPLTAHKKNCYTAVSDGLNELFLSSSPSVTPSQQFFLCCQGWRIPAIAKISTVFKVRKCLFSLLRFFIRHLTLSIILF